MGAELRMVLEGGAKRDAKSLLYKEATNSASPLNLFEHSS